MKLNEPQAPEVGEGILLQVLAVRLDGLLLLRDEISGELYLGLEMIDGLHLRPLAGMPDAPRTRERP